MREMTLIRIRQPFRNKKTKWGIGDFDEIGQNLEDLELVRDEQSEATQDQEEGKRNDGLGNQKLAMLIFRY